MVLTRVVESRVNTSSVGSRLEMEEMNAFSGDKRASNTPVPNEQLALLFPCVIPLLHWIRQHNQDFTLSPFLEQDEKPETVMGCVKQLYAALEVTNHSLKNTQLRYIFSQYAVSVWISALVYILFKSSNPAIIPDSLKIELNRLKKTEYQTDMINMSYTLNKIGAKKHEILGEFFSFVKDSSPSLKTSEKVFMYLKSKLGLHETVIRKMVKHSPLLFGQSGCPEGLTHAGSRLKTIPIQWELFRTLPENKQNAQDLRNFFAMVQPVFADNCALTVELYDWKHVAYALNWKYQTIPRSWYNKLLNIKQIAMREKDKKTLQQLKWFVPGKVKTPIPMVKQDGGSKVKLNLDPIKLKSANSAGSAFRDNKLNRVHQKIYQFIEGERDYLTFLEQVAQYYVHPLKRLARSPADRALIDAVFGVRFEDIMQFSQKFYLQLQPLLLMKGAPLLPGKSLAVEFSKLVVQMFEASLLEGYLSYSSTYFRADQLIEWSQFGGTCYGFWNEVRINISMMESSDLKYVLTIPKQRVQIYDTLMRKLLDAVRELDGVGAQETQNAIFVVQNILFELDESAKGSQQVRF